MDGLLLVGHGSLRRNSARTMEAVAAALRTRQAARRIEACFLNYGAPTLQDAAARLIAEGVSRVRVQPYFLAPGQYVLQDLPAQVRGLRAEHPHARFRILPVLGDHRRMLDMLRAKMTATERDPPPDAFVLIAHGSPYPDANRQVRRLARQLRARTGVANLQAAFLDLEAPDLATGCRLALAEGGRRITVIPFFLHAGRHVMEDLPRILAEVRAEAPPGSILTLTSPLTDVDALAAVIFDQCVGAGAASG